MLVLLFALILFFWLFVGAVQFLLCVAVPRLRRYALSAALWWAVWGPCSVGLMLLAGLAFVTDSVLAKEGNVTRLHSPHLLERLGWGYLILGTLLTASIATVMSWLHQVVMRRFTFALFRLYATGVTAGIGSVFGWALGWWIASTEFHYRWALWGVSMMALVGGFGALAHRGARSLRGDAPETLAWATKEEFEGA